jgi:S-methyl-5-thioribose-1-phosphate isomerase
MEGSTVYLINQTLLPFEFSIYRAEKYQDCCYAIETMVVRGAGAIGATAGFAMAQAFLEADKHNNAEIIEQAKIAITATRPTAQDLFYAVERVFRAGIQGSEEAVKEASAIAEENVKAAKQIGFFGNVLIEDGFRIATHCNAGWLGFVDYGSALSPIYTANEHGKKVFVYVDETRPRSQGARLTAWELANEGVPHAIIADNATAYFMAKGDINLMIVGADRIAANGDVANKIGTLEKAIIAEKYGIPFYVTAPLSTIDLNTPSGDSIPIEERDPSEVIFMEGPETSGKVSRIRVTNPGSDVMNPAFDVTPAGLISGIITEKGLVKADQEAINQLFQHD